MSNFDDPTGVTEEMAPVFVDVRSSDPGVEVSMLDGRLEAVAHGVGGLKTTLKPGVYKLVAQTGPDEHEELVLLRGHSFTKSLEPLKFASPIPMDETSRSHEYHMEAAARHSAAVHVSKGAGSKLFVFARDWTPESVASDPAHNPAEGLTLCTLAGVQLVDFETDSVRSNFPDPRADPYAACTVELDPGSYRVGVKLSDGQVFEQIVMTAPGWRTDMFLLQRQSTGSRSGKHPDLAGAAISLSQQPAFEPYDPSSRLTETARLALRNRRPIASGELAKLLDKKFVDPMLGIIGGHLILLGREPGNPLSDENRNLLQIVVTNLRALLGQSHQDVEALALAAGMPSQGDFNIPPMLHRSWQIIIDATVTKEAVTTASSLSGQIATQITNQDPWLIWQRVEAGVALDLETDDYFQAMTRLFLPAGRARFEQQRARRILDTVVDLYQKATSAFEKLFPALAGKPDAALDVTLKALLADDMMPRLVKTLGVPRANVEEIITAAYNKLKQNPAKISASASS